MNTHLPNPASPKLELPLCPLAALGFPALAALTLAAGTSPALAGKLSLLLGAAALIGILAGAFTFHLKDPPKPVALLRSRLPLLVMVCLSAALALGLYHLRWQDTAAPAQGLEGQEAPAELRILDYPEERYGRFYYQAQAVLPDREFRMLLSSAAPIFCRPGDTLHGTVRFYAFSSGGIYSTRNRRLSDGLALGGYLTGGYERTPRSGWSAGTLLAEVRNKAGRAVASLLPGELSGLIRAVLLGQRDQLEGTASTDFRQIGASHLLAVSGLHMTAAAAFLAMAVNRLSCRRWLKNLLTGAAVLCYLCVTGFPASAVRSFFMFALTLSGSTLGYRTHPLNSLGGAVLVLCLLNPFSGGDLGFALSVLSTLGLVTLCRPIHRRLTRPIRERPKLRLLLKPVMASLAVTLSVTAATLPLQLAEFGGISLAAPLANLLLVPPVTALLYCSLPMALFAVLGAVPLVQPLAFCAGWLARGTLWLANRLAAVPLAFFSLRGPVWLVALVCLLLILFLYRRRKLQNRLLALCLSALVAAGACLVQTALWQDVVTVALAGDENSLCVLLIRNGRAAGVSLGGYNSGAAEWALSGNNVWSAGTFLLPDAGADPRAMAADLLNTRRAQALLLPEGTYRGKDLERTGTPIYEIPGGLSFEALPGVWITPEEDWSGVWFSANGRTFFAELEAGGEAFADVLVTAQSDSRSDGAVTVYFGDAEDAVKDEFSPSGEFYALEEGETGVYLHVKKDGRVIFEVM